MFTSIDENAFRQAIRDKDYLALKVSTVSTMLDDPTFERGETDKVIEILKAQVPEIFEDEVKLDYEERLERSAWDKRYFTKLTYWFQENFALSRVEYIKEVGRAVHKDTAQQYKQSAANNKSAAPKVTLTSKEFKTASERPGTSVTKPVASTSKSTSFGYTSPKNQERQENFSKTGVIVAGVALVLVGILLAKLL